MSNSELTNDIINLMLQSLGLNQRKPEEVNENSLLREPPFDMDSIDVLEVVAAIEDKYKIKVLGPEEGVKNFQSVSSITNFVSASLN